MLHRHVTFTDICWDYYSKFARMYLCVVCVFFPFILDFNGRTSRGHTGRRSIHLLSAVLALILLARRIQPFLSLVDREVEFCVLTI